MAKKIGKIEFADRVAANLNEAGYKVTKKDVKEFIMEGVRKAIFESLSEATADEAVSVVPVDGVQLTCKQKPARTARNPRTGETVDVPAKFAVSGKATKSLSDFLND